MLIKDIGKQIKQERNRLGWSQVQLAKEADLSEQTIVNIEGGRFKPRWETMEKLQNALERGAARQAE